MLRNVKKNTLNINAYLSKVKNIVNQLALVGHTVTPLDQVDAIFNGLPEEYGTQLKIKDIHYGNRVTFFSSGTQNIEAS